MSLERRFSGVCSIANLTPPLLDAVMYGLNVQSETPIPAGATVRCRADLTPYNPCYAPIYGTQEERLSNQL